MNEVMELFEINSRDEQFQSDLQIGGNKMCWEYYVLCLADGKLYDQHLDNPFPNAPVFKNHREANQWLLENDIYGTVSETVRCLEDVDIRA